MSEPIENTSCCMPSRESESPVVSGGSCCGRPHAPAKGNGTRGMTKLEGGAFLMGCDHGTYPDDGEGPVREVALSPFYIDTCAVTNRQFDKFVKATGYETESEQFGWSFVFHLLIPQKVMQKLKTKPPGLPWWWKVPGSCWRNPEGRGTNIKDRMDHPAVHVSWNDALAYAEWAGKRLPTEAEYEYAARGGLEQETYPWGEELEPEGEHRCNIWQGDFPRTNTEADGFVGTAPVRSFKPNEYGLFNMSGNVWEWCWDWFSPDFHIKGPRENPAGPSSGMAKVMKGGSYLCHDSYCNRYRVSARTGNTPDSGTGNMGFRCVVDAE